MQLTEFVVRNWYLFVALAVIVALILAPIVMRLMHRISMVGPNEVVLLINRQNGVVVDIRDSKEFSAGHIVGAINLPSNDLPNRLSELNKYKQRPLVLTCRAGERAVKGAVLLRKHGFDNVRVLAGGMTAWERSQLPVER